jgi:hypothetical protein
VSVSTALPTADPVHVAVAVAVSWSLTVSVISRPPATEMFISGIQPIESSESVPASGQAPALAVGVQMSAVVIIEVESSAKVLVAFGSTIS